MIIRGAVRIMSSGKDICVQPKLTEAKYAHFEVTFYPCMVYITSCIGKVENIVSMNLLIFQILSKSVFIIRKLT